MYIWYFYLLKLERNKSAISDLEIGLDSQVKLKVTGNVLILRNMKQKQIHCIKI